MNPIILIAVLFITLITFVTLMPDCRRARHQFARRALTAEIDRNVEAMKAKIALAFLPVAERTLERLVATTDAAQMATAQFCDAMYDLRFGDGIADGLVAE